MIASSKTLSLDNIGSQKPKIMCHSTGIDVPPKDTAHLDMSWTGITLPLNT